MQMSASKGFAALGIRCAYCGSPATTVDHIIPRLLLAGMDSDEMLDKVGIGDPDDPSNLTPACEGCNCSKKDLLLEEWLRLCFLDSVDPRPTSGPRRRVLAAIRRGDAAGWLVIRAREVMEALMSDLELERLYDWWTR